MAWGTPEHLPSSTRVSWWPTRVWGRGQGPAWDQVAVPVTRLGPVRAARLRQSWLTLQLQQPAFEVSLLCGGLMSAPPSRPSNDEGWLNAPLRQSDRDAPDLLHRPGNLQAWR